MFQHAICPVCAIPLGVYEPFIWRMPDGSKIDCRSVPRRTEVEEALDERGERLHRACAGLEPDRT